MYYYYYYAVRRPLSREYGIAVPAFASHAALSLALTFFFFLCRVCFYAQSFFSFIMPFSCAIPEFVFFFLFHHPPRAARGPSMKIMQMGLAE